MDLVVITLKTIFFYFFILISYRIMGKREIGQLGTTDLIVSILIAELVAISIENFNDTILNTVIPIAVLVVMEIALAYFSIKSKFVRNFLDGKPTMIIKNGNVYMQAGAGIVADSIPEMEYEESHNKVRALVKTIGGEV